MLFEPNASFRFRSEQSHRQEWFALALPTPSDEARSDTRQPVGSGPAHQHVLLMSPHDSLSRRYPDA